MKELTVGQLVGQIKGLLEGEFPNVAVRGEVSGLTSSAAGHFYFSLNDQDSSMSCALFKMDGLRNPAIKKIKNGDEVLCHGSVGVYGKRGTFQLVVKRIFTEGKGSLLEKFEALKKKLAQEGLFDLERKLVIPKHPGRIAVITSPHGAAIKDFINIYRRRAYWMDVLIVPALVQGDDAPRSLIEAVKRAASRPDIELIIVTRGGGSAEDLWAFNDEQLAREISDCTIPIISAIGHERDYTICDYVADLRCETPSAAAEVITQEHLFWQERTEQLKKGLRSYIQDQVNGMRIRLQKSTPQNLLAQIVYQLTNYKSRLERCEISKRDLGLSEMMQYLDEMLAKLQTYYPQQLGQKKERVELLFEVLNALDPKRILERGYSIIRDKERPITCAKDYLALPLGQVISLQFYDGIERAVKK